MCRYGHRVDSHAWKWKEEIGPTIQHGGGRSRWVDEVVHYEDSPPLSLDETYDKFQIFLKELTQQADNEFVQEENDKLTTYIISYVLDESLNKIYASDCSFVEENGEAMTVQAEQEKGLLVLAQLLHQPIMEASWTENPDVFLLPQKFLQFCKEHQQSPLAKFCYTLMTGYIEYPDTVGEYNDHTNSRIFTSQVAVDVTRGGANPKFVGNTTRLFDFLLDFSCETNRRHTMSSYRNTTDYQQCSLSLCYAKDHPSYIQGSAHWIL
jgi:hypothetical protein